MKKMLYSFLILAVVLSFAVGAKGVSAVPITGTIHFGGGATPTGGTPGLGWTDATGMSFLGADVNDFPAPTGDFAGLGGAIATFATFDFAPLSPSPVVSLWSVPTGISDFMTFDLVSVSIVDRTGGSTTSFISLRGTGWLKSTIDGLDDTWGTWAFTSNSTTNTGFSFSADSAAAVPEPGTIALLGIGLAGLVGVGVRRRAKKNAA